MTISTTTSRAQYAGNGVTTIFSFPYRFLANGDLEVTLFDAAGTPDPQTLTTDYTVLGADNDAGGSVTMLVAPAVGETLVIRRVVVLTQETDYISGDSFPAETHERALDRLTMVDQQLQEQVDRSITIPLDNETFSGAMPAIVAGRFIRVNDAGTAFELVAVVLAGELVVSPFIETLLDDANAAAARATLVAAVSGANNDITSLSGLTTPLSLAQGGTGANHASVAALFAAIKQAASETATGVTEIATAAEAAARTAGTVITAQRFSDANIVQGTPVVTTSGTSIDFTSIPSWVKRITIMFNGVSTNGTSNIQVQIGDAGGVETSGYAGSVAFASTYALLSAGFVISNTVTAAHAYHGSLTLTKYDSTDTWSAVGMAGRSDAATVYFVAGTKTLSATLDRVRLTTASGVDTFDAGAINICYE